MANSESPGPDGGGSNPPQGEGYSDAEGTENIPGIIYCAFPRITTAMMGMDQSGLFMYDRDITPGQAWSAGNEILFLNSIEPKRAPFPEVVSLDIESFLEKLNLRHDEIPQDSERAQYLRFYVLARSKCMLVHLDMDVHCPEMTIANLAGIPVIGVSEKHSMSPMVRGTVDFIVNPVRSDILTMVKAVANRGG